VLRYKPVLPVRSLTCNRICERPKPHRAAKSIGRFGYKPGSTWTTDPLFMKVGSEYYFYQNDHLGTPQKMTTISGAVVWSAKYSSFGKAEIDPASTVTNNLRFPGQYYDQETTLHYNHHRYYDSSFGRYMTTDPIDYSAKRIRKRKLLESYKEMMLSSFFNGGDIGAEVLQFLQSITLDGLNINLEHKDPLFPNYYLFVSDSPVNKIDPKGLMVIFWPPPPPPPYYPTDPKKPPVHIPTIDPSPWQPNTPDFDPSPGDQFGLCVAACKALLLKTIKCPSFISSIPCGIVCIITILSS
ncbi:MAG: RHS repeat domain-containing protein, partial [Patescibacteria group bacterium]